MADLPPSSIVLVVERGGTSHRLVFHPTADRRVLLGRAPDCDVTIASAGVSRRHTMLVREGPQWLVVDLRSSNGTRLRGERVNEPTPVEPGDVLEVGDTRVVVDAVGAPTEAELAAFRLRVDMEDGRAHVERAGAVTVLPLSAAEFAWLAHLAWRRVEDVDGGGWVETGRDGHALLRAFMEPRMDRAWAVSLRTQPLAALARGEDVDDEDLKNLRGKTVQKLKKWCAEQGGDVASLLLPEKRGRGEARLPLAREAILFTGG